MHWIDRGPEPGGVEHYRSTYTHGWVNFYCHGVGERPRNSHWRRFTEDLRVVFHSLCGYCEEIDKGEVEHFRPKSLFPYLVYEWSNWLFACRACNQAKQEKWPAEGYIDPCDEEQRPLNDLYFDFDFETGHVSPNEGLTPDALVVVQALIDDLHLNFYHHLKKRRAWIEVLTKVWREPSGPVSAELKELVVSKANREVELSSLTRAWLAAHNCVLEDSPGLA